ncbi:nuclear transport factor 2 family protein [Novosphingobium colocasiae]|uniref:nuclear transport factor 2 family protein n=1 Tax=Novosphingobium colocasiae TaxID=1256513 RepID=UPI0035B0CA55
MTTNKDRAIEACRHLSDRNLDPVFAAFDDEGTWTMPYLPERFAFAGRRNKADMRALLDGFLGAFDTFEFRVEQAIADGDWVAIKGASTGTGPGTACYENTYHLLFHYRDGKVLEVRELFDPYQVEAYIQQVEAQGA